eukprot:2165267-Prymnesium_polylepis.1
MWGSGREGRVRVRREGLGSDRSIPGDTCTERVSGVFGFGCSRVECLEGVSRVSRRVGSRLECVEHLFTHE